MRPDAAADASRVLPNFYTVGRTTGSARVAAAATPSPSCPRSRPRRRSSATVSRATPPRSTRAAAAARVADAAPPRDAAGGGDAAAEPGAAALAAPAGRGALFTSARQPAAASPRVRALRAERRLRAPACAAAASRTCARSRSPSGPRRRAT